MKRLTATILALLACSSASAETIIGWVGIPLTQSTIAVPNVVGEANFAVADTILEAAGLDGGTETVVCSNETADEIIAQSPIAGTQVQPLSLVNLTSSSGSSCTDASGAEIILILRDI